MSRERPNPLLRPSVAFESSAPSPSDAGSTSDDHWSDELPNTAVEVLIELDGSWELDLDGRRTQVRSFAAGLIAGRVRTRAIGPVRLVQLSLDPLATVALFGVPAGELASGAFALDDLLGADASRLQEQIHDAGAGDPGIAHGETWLRDRIAVAERDRAAAVPADVIRACTLMRASGGTMRVGAVAEHLGCSRRHLTRRFDAFVGVGPAQFNRLLRFERATGSLRRNPSHPLGALAHQHGFADQSHMNREFLAFAGAAPSVVASRFA